MVEVWLCSIRELVFQGKEGARGEDGPKGQDGQRGKPGIITVGDLQIGQIANLIAIPFRWNQDLRRLLASGPRLYTIAFQWPARFVASATPVHKLNRRVESLPNIFSDPKIRN